MDKAIRKPGGPHSRINGLSPFLAGQKGFAVFGPA
jgi:hypothetical protein